MDGDDDKKKLNEQDGDGAGKAPDPKQKAGGDGAGKAPGPVPYERFAAVNEKFRLATERLTALEAAQEKAEETRLTEEKRWQELAEKRGTELEQERQSRLRFEVAAEAGVPVALAGRIQGADRVAMAKDAKSLLEFLKPGGGGLGMPPAPDGGEDTLDLASMTPEEIRKNAKKLWGK